MLRYSLLCVALLIVVAGVVRAQDAESGFPDIPPPPPFDSSNLMTLEEMMQLARKRYEVPTARVSKAWIISDTQVMLDLCPQLLGNDFSQDILPLPWEKYLGVDVKETHSSFWTGAEIVDGDNQWTVITIPVQQWRLVEEVRRNSQNYVTKKLTEQEQSDLLSEFLDHPLGKHFFPDGNARLFFTGTEADVVHIVTEDFPENPRDRDPYLLQMLYVLQRINHYCHIGVRIDSNDPTSDEADQGGTMLFGFRPNEDGDGYTTVFRDSAKDGTPLAVARAARMACQLPGRVAGFYDEDSQVILSHRFFPEESGLGLYCFHVGTTVVPAEERNEDRIYCTNMGTGMKSDNTLPAGVETVFQAGDFHFFYTPQEELPPEEGVPGAGEMNAVNRAFHESLQPLVEQIAAKITGGSKPTPVDLCAKSENGVIYLAVGFEPGEEDVAIDWSRLDTVDLTFLKLHNPYCPKDAERIFSLDVTDSHAGEWREVVFTTVDCSFEGVELSLVLGQGPGILCGAVPLENRNAKPANMIAGLEKCLEESEQILAAGDPWDAPSVFRYESDEGVVCWANVFSDFQGEKTFLAEIYMQFKQRGGTLTYLAQMLSGIMSPGK